MAKNEAYFFSHDYNARNDIKLQRVMLNHGLAGMGAYWGIVEQLYENGGKLPLDFATIAFGLHTDDISLIEHVVMDYGLFEHNDTEFWSNSIYNRLKKRQEVSEKRKAASAKRWKEYNANAMQVNSTCKASEIQLDSQTDDTAESEETPIEEKSIAPTTKEENAPIKIDATPTLPTHKEDNPASAKRFVPPKIEEVREYCQQRQNNVDAEKWYNFYSSKGWMIGKNKMKDWQACVRTWEQQEENNPQKQSNNGNGNRQHEIAEPNQFVARY